MFERVNQLHEMAPSWSIDAKQQVSVPIFLSDNMFENGQSLLGQICPGNRRLVVVDRKVNQLYGDSILKHMEDLKFEVEIHIISAGEQNKSVSEVLRLIDAMDDFKISRRSDAIIAFGGGVVLDIVGLAANLFRRGVPSIRVPTTLMAQIDAGIGVKTGINYSNKKNHLGTYYAPSSVIIDRTFLRSLSDREIRNGLAEILKIALVKDAALFALLQKTADRIVDHRLQGAADFDEIFDRSIRGMLEELNPNLWEYHLERVVDYGHTFSPAIEMAALPSLLHGEAVAIDMALSLSLAFGRDLMNFEEMKGALAIFSALDLPAFHPLLQSKFLFDALEDTALHRGNLQRTPLTAGIGKCVFVNDITEGELQAAVSRLRLLFPTEQACA
ncbi:sedoheptulose 7-phosphate cyclase [Agrobacterium rhizogenes]|nr:sedoheptulose 7-phosphate cyclase [Rhizobium rhizogenes]NTF78966.1 sedoheptulose 7-phosphate cyclase [Rhizobium rhizogenes]NTJ51495.1 sedoheptulose 7-phosphate cyclase [Rhizobium rhizogenes]